MNQKEIYERKSLNRIIDKLLRRYRKSNIDNYFDDMIDEIKSNYQLNFDQLLYVISELKSELF